MRPRVGVRVSMCSSPACPPRHCVMQCVNASGCVCVFLFLSVCLYKCNLRCLLSVVKQAAVAVYFLFFFFF